MNAEITYFAIRPGLRRMLQWGRVQMNAEIDRSASSSASSSSLQWGRVQMNAEIQRAGAHLLRAIGLQWGRVQMNAEMGTKAHEPDEQRKASMGPRSDERGNIQVNTLRAQHLELQWGRVQMNAEIPTSVKDGQRTNNEPICAGQRIIADDP